MRLIKEDDVMKIIDEELKLRCGYDSDIALLSVKKQIAKLPTAFNVDKVVEELDELFAFNTVHYGAVEMFEPKEIKLDIQANKNHVL